jgi:hypothetical protein
VWKGIKNSFIMKLNNFPFSKYSELNPAVRDRPGGLLFREVISG